MQITAEEIFVLLEYCAPKLSGRLTLKEGGATRSWVDGQQALSDGRTKISTSPVWQPEHSLRLLQLKAGNFAEQFYCKEWHDYLSQVRNKRFVLTTVVISGQHSTWWRLSFYREKRPQGTDSF